MKNKKIEKRRLRAIVRSGDYYTSCLPFPVVSFDIGMFPQQEAYKGKRLFAVYLREGRFFMRAFDLLSSAKRFVRDLKKQYSDFSFDIIAFEACAS